MSEATYDEYICQEKEEQRYVHCGRSEDVLRKSVRLTHSPYATQTKLVCESPIVLDSGFNFDLMTR